MKKISTASDLENYRLPPNRKCAGCGKPTHNYRCDECWKKIRGHCEEAAGETHAYTRQVTVMEETPVSQYSLKELAAIAGEKAQYLVQMRHHAKKGSPFQTERAQAVYAKLAAKGVDIFGAPVEGEPFPLQEEPAVPAPITPEPAPTGTEFNAAKAEEHGEFAAGILEQLAARREEMVPADGESAQVESPGTLDAPPRPNYGADFANLSHIPLEALVGEITRRMPRAEIVLR